MTTTFNAIFYCHLDSFLAARENPTQDRALLDSAIDGHKMRDYPALRHISTSHLPAVRRKLLLAFKEYLQAVGINSLSDIVR